MSENAAEPLNPQLDQLIAQAAGSVVDGPALPYPVLFRGANLGFTLEQARTVAADHASLVFLNRLWDAQRVDGAPVGRIRVPQKVWSVAGTNDETGQANARLLELTGMRTADWDSELELHLMLWAQAPQPVRYGGLTAVPLDQVTCELGPLSVQVLEFEPTDLQLRVASALRGVFEVTLFWPGGSEFGQRCAFTAPGEQHYALPGAPPTLPVSVRVIQKAEDPHVA
jgi:hypothetical protein